MIPFQKKKRDTARHTIGSRHSPKGPIHCSPRALTCQHVERHARARTRTHRHTHTCTNIGVIAIAKNTACLCQNTPHPTQLMKTQEKSRNPTSKLQGYLSIQESKLRSRGWYSTSSSARCQKKRCDTGTQVDAHTHTKAHTATLPLTPQHIPTPPPHAHADSLER